MNKSVSILLLILFSTIIIGTNYGQVYGNTDVPPSFEEIFTEGGYKTVTDALTEFEQHFNQELNLPLRIPPLNFTHRFGRFHNLDDDINDSFEMKFISDESPENHFKIDIRPIKYRIEFSSKKFASKTYKLNNGIDAKYIKEIPMGFNLFVFEKSNWQYVFSIDKRVSEKVPPEILVQIANSIDY